MCGLVLLINKNKNGFSQQQQNVFNSLLYISGGFRGRDGTGVISIDNIGNLKLAKAAMTVDSFLCTKEMDTLEKHAYQNGWAMIGHNRSATKGSITDANSHPFWMNDNTVLVHNGTFFGDHKHLKNTEVDSEAICHLIEEHENPEEALQKVNAAYALIWYDVGAKSIHLIRNNSRPLWYVETTDSYLFASEESFLKFVIDKFKLKTDEIPYEMESGILGTYKLNKDKSTTFDDKKIKHEYHHVQQPYQNNTGTDTFMQDNPHYKEIFLAVVETLKDKIKPFLHGGLKELCAKYSSANPVRVKPIDFIEAKPTYGHGEDFIVIGKTMDENEILVAFKVYLKKLEDVLEMVENGIYDLKHQGIVWRRAETLFPVDSNSPLDTWNGIPMIHGYMPERVKLIAHANVH